MKQRLIDFYLEWVNDYLTLDRMAEHYEMDQADVIRLIKLGKKYHEENVIRLKAIKS